jgi:hypothetical protein
MDKLMREKVNEENIEYSGERGEGEILRIGRCVAKDKVCAKWS